MKIVLGLLFLTLSFCAPYPSVTYTFSPNTIIKGSEVNSNYANIISGFSDGSKRHNFYELYINSNLALDYLMNATLKTLALTETLSVVGNTTMTGTMTVPTATITKAIITTASIAQLNATTINANTVDITGTMTVPTATITQLNAPNINAGTATLTGTITANKLSGTLLGAADLTSINISNLIKALPKAWVSFGGLVDTATCTINAQYNVSSVSRNSQGDYTVIFTSPISANYSASIGCEEDATNQQGVLYGAFYRNTLPTGNSIRFNTRILAGFADVKTGFLQVWSP